MNCLTSWFYCGKMYVSRFDRKSFSLSILISIWYLNLIFNVATTTVIRYSSTQIFFNMTFLFVDPCGWCNHSAFVPIRVGLISFNSSDNSSLSHTGVLNKSLLKIITINKSIIFFGLLSQTPSSVRHTLLTTFQYFDRFTELYINIIREHIDSR